MKKKKLILPALIVLCAIAVVLTIRINKYAEYKFYRDFCMEHALKTGMQSDLAEHMCKCAAKKITSQPGVLDIPPELSAAECLQSYAKSLEK